MTALKRKSALIRRRLFVFEPRPCTTKDLFRARKTSPDVD